MSRLQDAARDVLVRYDLGLADPNVDSTALVYNNLRAALAAEQQRPTQGPSVEELVEALRFALVVCDEWTDQFDPSDEAATDVRAARNEHREGTENIRALIARHDAAVKP